MFSKFFKKKQKELNELTDFNYTIDTINISIDIEQASNDVRTYLELIIEELIDENLVTFSDGIIKINHKDVYNISSNYLAIFSFPKFFNGSLEVELEGLINQDNSKFIIHLYETSNIKIKRKVCFIGYCLKKL